MAKVYSERLGRISDEQFQAALDRFDLGRFIRAEPIPFGVFGQNVFVTTTTGEYVLRGSPHFWWQFPTEQFYTQQFYDRTQVPVPWPYLIADSPEIFGWSYAIMPRMPGVQLSDPPIREHLGWEERQGIAQALGENLAQMQTLTWPFAGRYNATSGTVEAFDLATEQAWPFPPERMPHLASVPTKRITYPERVVAVLRHNLARAQSHNASTSEADIAWVEEVIAEAQEGLDLPFEPCLIMEDYKEGNLVVRQDGARWRVSGVFDLMGAHFGDGEADLARQMATYLDEDPQLARAFLGAYFHHKPPRVGFRQRFSVYMLLDRSILWEFFQQHYGPWGPEGWTFRDWAGQYISPDFTLIAPGYA